MEPFEVGGAAFYSPAALFCTQPMLSVYGNEEKSGSEEFDAAVKEKFNMH